MADAVQTVPLIGGVATDGPEGFARGGIASIDPDVVREELKRIRDALAPVMNEEPAGGLTLQQLEVEVGITVGGKVGLIAEGSVEGAASITLTFARNTGT
jgi:hypothetical protein